jgi:hypothetical protein
MMDCNRTEKRRAEVGRELILKMSPVPHSPPRCLAEPAQRRAIRNHAVGLCKINDA